MHITVIKQSFRVKRTLQVAGPFGLCMYVCMVITYSKSMDRPGEVANPAARGQLNWENEYSPVRVRA